MRDGLGRWTGVMVLLALGVMTPVAALAQTAPALPLAETTGRIYVMLTGSPSQGAGLRTQIDQAAEMVFGPAWQSRVDQSLARRAQDLLAAVTPGDPNTSLLSRLMAVEWYLNQELYELSLLREGKKLNLPSTDQMPLRPVVERLGWMEQVLYGQQQQGALMERVDRVAREVWGGTGRVRIGTKAVKIVPVAGTVRVRLLAAVSNEPSNPSKRGDKLPFVTLDDLVVEGALVIPRGMVGVAQVDEVEPPGPLGRPGKLSASGFVWAIDGTRLWARLKVGQPGGSRESAAAGATALGAAAAGPLGVTAGLLVQGEARRLEANTEVAAEIGPPPGIGQAPVQDAILAGG